jgi:hypothetical protein
MPASPDRQRFRHPWPADWAARRWLLALAITAGTGVGLALLELARALGCAG